MEELVQVIGAVLILSAFLLSQLKVIDGESPLYLVLNLAGSAVLAWIALSSRDWGFVLLEGMWAVVSAVALLKLSARKRTTG
ncbi:hypothetical protein N5079_28065 [Planotetraspora sp. A-T 1434]|uniref:CBU_0592 family membrane protein n=1 Tax=Planotetraspora sp. A-T 1434 TaxID=2979219 RepID=UPI0021C24F7F|nr:hypothetical protein [Planotetraspora sp. A-T 1434]MCT9934072.1 hypothetical protein [Planotetraspora sp. A-T 1434]